MGHRGELKGGIMDVLNSLRSEFDVINDKLDFIVVALKDKSIDNDQIKKYSVFNKIREEIDYNGE